MEPLSAGISTPLHPAADLQIFGCHSDRMHVDGGSN